MGDKDKIIALPHVDATARQRLAERMRALHITRIDEMPRIELYLDQVLTLVTQELEFMQVPGETLVTGSMVNNYVKQGVIPAPRKKRYTRRHVASLLFVCALKRVFSISQVSQLAALIWSSELDLEALYDSSWRGARRRRSRGASRLAASRPARRARSFFSTRTAARPRRGSRGCSRPPWTPWRTGSRWSRCSSSASRGREAWPRASTASLPSCAASSGAARSPR